MRTSSASLRSGELPECNRFFEKLRGVVVPEHDLFECVLLAKFLAQHRQRHSTTPPKTIAMLVRFKAHGVANGQLIDVLGDELTCITSIPLQNTAAQAAV